MNFLKRTRPKISQSAGEKPRIANPGTRETTGYARDRLLYDTKTKHCSLGSHIWLRISITVRVTNNQVPVDSSCRRTPFSNIRMHAQLRPPSDSEPLLKDTDHRGTLDYPDEKPHCSKSPPIH